MGLDYQVVLTRSKHRKSYAFVWREVKSKKARVADLVFCRRRHHLASGPPELYCLHYEDMSSSSSSATSGLLSRLGVPAISAQTQRLIVVAAASCSLTTVAILSTQLVQRRTKRAKLRDQVEKGLRPPNENGVGKDRVGDDGEDELVDWTRPPSAPSRRGTDERTQRRQKPTSDIIIRESLARNYVFFTESGMHKIRNAFVVVVGVGGVGSAAAVMLARSGVKKIRLVDFDQVSLSSLNVSGLSAFCVELNAR